MTALRLRRPEIAAARSSETASVAVAAESERLAVAGETPNRSEKIGMRGWVQCRIANVTNPPANSAATARRKAPVPGPNRSPATVSDVFFAYLPRNCGSRFSTKAFRASFESSVDWTTAMWDETRSRLVRRSLRADW